jgi:hypothetical protein
MINPPTRFEAALARFRSFFVALRWPPARRGYVPTLNLAKPHHYCCAVSIAFAFSLGIIIGGCYL